MTTGSKPVMIQSKLGEMDLFGMFLNRTPLLKQNAPQMSYGIAISDIDGDGEFEAFVTGFGFPNKVLKVQPNGEWADIAEGVLADANSQSIGVAACDLDDDGLEELYVLNTDTFEGAKRLGDRLFDYMEGQWTDLFSVPAYRHMNNMIAGRSVACVDRLGNGRYGFFVANYGGFPCLYELDEDGYLQDVSEEAGLNYLAGGRSVIALPLVSPAHMDIFMGNEMGMNFLFRNRGDGTFEEMAEYAGISDPIESVRGVAVLDNDRGLFDIVYGNWEGFHRFYRQVQRGRFINRTPTAMAAPSRVRTVIAADFDNDGYQEIFFNNIGQSNRLFGYRNGKWVSLDVGEATEPFGLGTGASVADLDGDGRLELLIAHGEAHAQPLSLYHVVPNDNHWLRVLPLTPHGAPARGAIVTIQAGERQQKRAIDTGSGYLCQMEPVAHFGLGEHTEAILLKVEFTDGQVVHLDQLVTADQVIRVAHPMGEA